MAKAKILFITHEMSPFLELSKISEVTRQLPQAMQDRGFEIRILIPRFGSINERRNRLHEVIRLSGMNIVVNNNDNPLIIKVASLPSARIQVYFLDNEDFFQRKGVFKDDQGAFFADNTERSLFFGKGALETVKKLGWSPDVIHCHGWFSALVPAYLKTVYKDDPTFKDSKVFYSLYNEEFCPGSLCDNYSEIAQGSNLSAEHADKYGDATYEDIYKGAISFSDLIIKMDNEVSSNLLEFAAKEGVRVLETDGGEMDYESYASLYDKFVSEQELSA